MSNAEAGPSSSPLLGTSPNWNSLASTSIYYDSVPSGAHGAATSGTNELDVVPLRANRQLCVRHKQMANQDVNQKLQRSLDNLSTAERSDITHLWSTFSGAPHAKRKIILEGILTMCCFSQLSHLSDSLNQIIRIDPFSLLPREVNLRILGYLDAFSLGRAAQVSKSWKALADDDLLWRRMCGQHIDRKCEKCGWGLPLLERRRLKVELNEGSPAVAVSIGGHDEHAHAHGHGPPDSNGVGSGHVHGDEADSHHHGARSVLSREEALGTGSRALAHSMSHAHAHTHGPAGALQLSPHGEGVCGSGTGINSLKRNGGGGAGGGGSSEGIDSDLEGGEEGSRKRLKTDELASAAMAAASISGSVSSSASTSVDGVRNKGKGKERQERDESPVRAAAAAAAQAQNASSVQARMTKPWKSVYCERLVVERNWRKGRCKTTTLKGHEDGVMCLQYHTALSTPNHPVLITGSYDKTVRVWNLDTGECLRTLRGHTRAVRALQFDQRLLFTGSMDGTVRMWNWRAGECLRVLEGHTDGVVALHYNGRLLASGSADSTVNIWNFRNGSKFTLRGHEERVNAVLLWDGKTSPGDLDPTMMPTFSGKRGVSPSRGGSGMGMGMGMSTPHGMEGRRTSVSPVASTTTSTSYASSASASGHASQHSGEAPVEAGMMLFSASDDHTIKLWDLSTRQCIRTFKGHRAHVQSVKLLMVDLTEAEIRARKRLRSASPPVDASAAGGLWSTASAPLAPLLGNAASAAGMSDMLVDVPEGFDPHAHRTARGKAVQPRVFLHDAAGHVSTPDVEMAEGDVLGQHAHAQGHGQGLDEREKEDKEQKRAVLVSASLDGTVKTWDVETGCEMGTFFGHIEGVWGVDADALRIASASHDRTVKVWDRDAGTCVQTLVGHRGAVTTLQLSDDMIVSGSDDGDVMVWSFAPNAAGSSNGVPASVAIASPTPTPHIPIPISVPGSVPAPAPALASTPNSGPALSSNAGSSSSSTGLAVAPQLLAGPSHTGGAGTSSVSGAGGAGGLGGAGGQEHGSAPVRIRAPNLLRNGH